MLELPLCMFSNRAADNSAATKMTMLCIFWATPSTRFGLNQTIRCAHALQMTALHMAARSGQTLALYKLINCQSIDVNMKDVWGYTPLDHAVSLDYMECCLLIISQGGALLSHGGGGATCGNVVMMLVLMLSPTTARVHERTVACQPV